MELYLITQEKRDKMKRQIKKMFMVMLVVMISLASLSAPSFAAQEKRGTSTGNFRSGIGWVAEAEGWVYYLYQGDLCRRIQGEDHLEILVEKIDQYLPDSYLGSLNIMDGWVYFRTLNGSVYRVAVEGGNPQLFISGDKYGGEGVQEFIIVDDWIYYNYVVYNDSLKRCSKIYRMRLDGSGEQILVDNEKVYWLQDVIGGYVYFLGNDHQKREDVLFRIQVEGGHYEQVESTYKDLQIAGDWMYYLSNDEDGYLYRSGLDGTETQLIYDQGKCMFINVSVDWVYCLIDPGSGLYRDWIFARVRNDGTQMQVLQVGGFYFMPSVAGDMVGSYFSGTMRIREDGQKPYLEKLEPGAYS